MNLRAFLTIGSFLAAMALGVFWLWPHWQSIQQLRDKNTGIPALELKRDQLQKENQKISLFAKNFQDIAKSDRERVFAAIPLDVDQPALLVQLDALTRENGFVLKSIGITPSGPAAVGSASAVGLNFSVEGNPESFLKLTDALAESLRIIDVGGFKFSPEKAQKQAEEAETPSFGVTAFTYYLPKSYSCLHMPFSLPEFQIESLKILFARREARMGLILAGVLLVGGAVFFFFIRAPQAPEEAATPPPVISPVSEEAVPQFDLSILQDERFLRMRSFGELPIVPPEDRREDPFRDL